jgi:hypothetical protein
MIQKFDFFYRSIFFKKFINNLAYGGSYFLVEKIIYTLLADLSFGTTFYSSYRSRIKLFPIFLFFEVIFICRPLLQVRIWKFKKRGKKKLGKKGKALNTKVIPTNIEREKAYYVTLKWLVQSIRSHAEKKLGRGIAKEFQEILVNCSGATIEKKRKLYNLIVINRSFAHFRW